MALPVRHFPGASQPHPSKPSSKDCHPKHEDHCKKREPKHCKPKHHCKPKRRKHCG